MIAIQTEGLSRQFGSVQAVNNVSFAAEEGEVFGLLGPNGAGKTTLVRLLNGILAPTGGSARVLGYDPATQGDEVRQRTGVLTETPSLYERLTARENLRFFGTLYGISDSELPRRVDELLRLFELEGRADSRVGGFSKGMKQRLALARTLIHEPKVLFFDEPTSGLDPEAAHQVTNLIERLSRERGRTVFLCTHNLDEAQRLCNRVGVINAGKLLAVGSPAQLARDLWQGVWVDITLRAAPDAKLLEMMRGIGGVTHITADGLQVSAQVQAEDCIPNIVASAAGAGAQIMRVNPREYTLEEIYFRLQEEAKS
jgi:ABC-2 type transport system ATP-binding protein